MQKIVLTTLLILTLETHSFFLLAQNTESKKLESQNSAQNSVKVSTVKIISNALLLAEIYRKIQKISGNEDKNQLTPLLNQLNNLLDEVLAFKNSFSGFKKQKVENQLFNLKNQIQALAQSQSKELKKNSLELTSTLLDLVDTLLDKARPESKPSTL